MHACSACGNVGHGAADCRLHAPQTEVEVEEPPVEPTPPLPAFARPKSASVSVPLPAESRQYEAQYVPGFGKKGEGKFANYGIGIPPPSPVPPAEVPNGPLPSGPTASAAAPLTEEPPSVAPMPPPIAATTEEVEDWLRSGFKKLKNISTKTPPEVGEPVLWRGVKTGSKGGLPTKVEHFNGKVRGVNVEADGELYIYVD